MTYSGKALQRGNKIVFQWGDVECRIMGRFKFQIRGMAKTQSPVLFEQSLMRNVNNFCLVYLMISFRLKSGCI